MPLKCETNLLQDLGEFTDFLKLISEQKVRSYLEIGSKHGGSFWRISTSLPKGSRVVSVDLPHGDKSFKDSEPNLRQCVSELHRRGYDAHLFLTDSTDAATIESVRKLGPFDLVFLDGNHSDPFLQNDWHHYGSLARLVAFHDISWPPTKPPPKGMPCDVQAFWKSLKLDYKHIEFRRRHDECGIGVLWR
jgi:predicted O-methyltransferase YrrM